jgi:predicted metal-dependent hydrolase
VTNKSRKISTFLDPFRGRKLDAHYAAYFDCFNRQLFFEAHDVLEELWLAQRTGPNYAFYKGLIQLAGAFVHLQKNRLFPAGSLFKLAKANLNQYPPVHEHLDVKGVLKLIEGWLLRLEETQFETNPLTSDTAPKLKLQSEF